MEFTEAKKSTAPAAIEGRQIDKELDAIVDAIVEAGKSLKHTGSNFVTSVRRVAADEPLTTLTCVIGAGFLAGVVWKSTR